MHQHFVALGEVACDLSPSRVTDTAMAPFSPRRGLVVLPIPEGLVARRENASAWPLILWFVAFIA